MFSGLRKGKKGGGEEGICGRRETIWQRNGGVGGKWRGIVFRTYSIYLNRSPGEELLTNVPEQRQKHDVTYLNKDKKIVLKMRSLMALGKIKVSTRNAPIPPLRSHLAQVLFDSAIPPPQHNLSVSQMFEKRWANIVRSVMFVLLRIRRREKQFSVSDEVQFRKLLDVESSEDSE